MVLVAVVAVAEILVELLILDSSKVMTHTKLYTLVLKVQSKINKSVLLRIF
jgi:hypothetical protein